MHMHMHMHEDMDRRHMNMSHACAGCILSEKTECETYLGPAHRLHSCASNRGRTAGCHSSFTRKMMDSSVMRTNILDALHPPPPDAESADGAKDADEKKRLRIASTQMLEGIVFKLLLSTRQNASATSWVGLSVSTTEIVDVVSATLGTDTATRQQVLTPSHGPHALGSHAPWQLGPHLRTC
jgi:hypothetical protein